MSAYSHHPASSTVTLPLPAGSGHVVPLAVPAARPVRLEQPAGRALFDVMGGIAFAMLVSLCMIRVCASLFTGSGWAAAIGWESVWIMACLVCAPMLPSGVRHVITLRATVRGLALDWPELTYSLYMLSSAVSYGMQSGIIGPLGLALAVGTAEEFLFRVLLLGWLVTRLKPEKALVVSAVVFGLAHLHEPTITGLLSVAPQTAGGMVLGAMYLRSRNPLPCIIAHAAWDFPIFLAYGQGVSGGGTESGMPGVMALAPWLALIVYGLYLVRAGIDLPGREPRPVQVGHA